MLFESLVEALPDKEDKELVCEMHVKIAAWYVKVLDNTSFLLLLIKLHCRYTIHHSGCCTQW